MSVRFYAHWVPEATAPGGKIKIVGGVVKPTRVFPGAVEKPVKFKDGGGTWVPA